MAAEYIQSEYAFTVIGRCQQFVLIPWIFLAFVFEWKHGEPNRGTNLVQCYMNAIHGMRDVGGEKEAGI